MSTLYHLTEAQTWNAAVATGEYRQSTRGVSLERQGFIHCSLAHQVRRVAEFVYADAEDLVLLEIDPDRLAVGVVFEPGESPPSATNQPLQPGATEEFPHIYGPVPVGAVVNVVPVTRDGSGRMVLPG
jgi:uncharacterized protein (DUF952 family)